MTIQRYLGNKSQICNDIVALTKSVASDGDVVFDAFSGSLAVSRALKSAGFKVACNDINHFSWLYARAYISASELPWPDGPRSRGGKTKAACWSELIEELTEPYGKEIPIQSRRSDIFDHYCEAGPKSSFVSLRGSAGRRRFFSAENARAIDRALSRIRLWHRTGVIGEHVRCLLGASLLSAVERVSNTQGTYHDFPRSFTDPRALNPIRLLSPCAEDFSGPASAFIGKAEDSLLFAQTLPSHRVVYIDPPYNFRQYTSYYFMLNMLSMYPEIDDIDGFFSNIEHVRGQNMGVDFKSTFCSKQKFIPSLELLIERTDAKYVILSYFNGRNHWGSFKSDNDQSGRVHLEKLFRGPLFVEGSFRCSPINRMNYQSYGGFKSQEVQEFLFIAEKRRVAPRMSRGGAKQWIGQVSG
jgi:adenine-specific DNA methylase